ncbi:MAG TPA: hypothetical protein PLS30_11860 [Flavobacteriales bacterium]|jgi:hypothetical protein|nr:hypothetical protein [Flavobacteriales bacterium]MBK7112112.1 hypothetical protein [Flavobacteriales bacterium]MBK7618865.1 hypothetical protein [Flavobacteriales bacterium]MBK8532306.1 hypothetical protein [Flavobacteriales bacterium]MBK8709030.1 hypothetical protein [Flavobacteriales bacterium]
MKIRVCTRSVFAHAALVLISLLHSATVLGQGKADKNILNGMPSEEVVMLIGGAIALFFLALIFLREFRPFGFTADNSRFRARGYVYAVSRLNGTVRGAKTLVTNTTYYSQRGNSTYSSREDEFFLHTSQGLERSVTVSHGLFKVDNGHGISAVEFTPDKHGRPEIIALYNHNTGDSHALFDNIDPIVRIPWRRVLFLYGAVAFVILAALMKPGNFGIAGFLSDSIQQVLLLVVAAFPIAFLIGRSIVQGRRSRVIYRRCWKLLD